MKKPGPMGPVPYLDKYIAMRILNLGIMILLQGCASSLTHQVKDESPNRIFASDTDHLQGYATFRSDVNSVFFGGAESNRRFVSTSLEQKCELVVTNEDGNTVLSLKGAIGGDLLFAISPQTPNLTAGATHDPDHGVLDIFSGDQSTNHLEVNKGVNGFSVIISNGLSVPASCLVK